ncbi:MAG: hypothetical protein UW68_C0059G0002 [Candidatus Collierbacteria bacterium GW2011_GWB1_44_6]|uniref:Glycosyltransferase subfamily 4-like N-terminal domain-containing protein n=1 Tax=Candidatus Collierbacteria bacterium GW2011_GWB1_44_6 TaxID=1618384 RepID=A0A0G1JJZ4_9BACT|nr:MAG: hypothetical protein UW68_C0059G0002 [Candidatus Collierbacteria bacterium GW2011_GWB1_44_6]
MRILIIVPYYPPYSRNGTELLTEALANQLKKKNKVTVITTGPRNTKTVGKNLTVYRLRTYGKSWPLRVLQQIIFFFNKAMKLEKQDIIVAHMMTSAGVVAPIIGKLRKTPVVSRLTGFEMRMNPLYKSLILKPILKNLF